MNIENFTVNEQLTIHKRTASKRWVSPRKSTRKKKLVLRANNLMPTIARVDSSPLRLSLAGKKPSNGEYYPKLLNKISKKPTAEHLMNSGVFSKFISN